MSFIDSIDKHNKNLGYTKPKKKEPKVDPATAAFLEETIYNFVSSYEGGYIHSIILDFGNFQDSIVTVTLECRGVPDFEQTFTIPDGILEGDIIAVLVVNGFHCDFESNIFRAFTTLSTAKQ